MFCFATVTFFSSIISLVNGNSIWGTSLLILSFWGCSVAVFALANKQPKVNVRATKNKVSTTSRPKRQSQIRISRATARSAAIITTSATAADHLDSNDATFSSSIEPAPSGLDTEDDMSQFVVNPANGMPMVGGIGGIDVEGNPYGLDLSQNTSNCFEDTCSSSIFDDSSSCSWDDSFIDSSCDDSFSSSSFDDPW